MMKLKFSVKNTDCMKKWKWGRAYKVISTMKMCTFMVVFNSQNWDVLSAMVCAKEEA